MLNHKIKLNNIDSYDEISVESIFLSTDCSFISGTTSINSELIDGQTVMIEFNENGNFIDAILNCKKVTRQGYVLYNKKYKVIKYNNYKGYWFNDGKFYFIDTNEEYVTKPTKYWITDNTLTIDDITYDVDIELYRYPYKVNKKTKIEEKIDNSQIKTLDYENYDLIFKYEIDSENPPYILIKDNITLPIYNCNKNDWYEVYEFIIKKELDFELKIDSISCASRFPYVYYGKKNEKQYNDQNSIINGDNIKHYFKYDSDKGKYVTTINNNVYELKNDRITIGDDDYIIGYEWRNVPLSETLHLFVDNINFSFVPGQKIIVQSSSQLRTRVECDDEGNFLYCGKHYKKEETTLDYALLSGKEYEIFYTEKRWGINDSYTNANAEKYGYIIFDNSPILISLNGNKYYAPYSNFSGEVKSYEYIIIDDDKFVINSYEKFNYDTNGNIVKLGECHYVDINKIERFILNIDEVVSNSMLRCHPIVDENGDYRSVCSTIVSNKDKFNFMLFNELFGKNNVSIEGYINKETNNDSFDIIKLYNPSSYIEMPLLFGNNYMGNASKEDIVENFFFKKEKEESINSIVDMEREIYYPTYNNDKGEKEDINEIIFDLHFRSRNLNDWKINDDIYGSLTESEREEVKTRYTWNLFDYYNWIENNNDSGNTKPNISKEYDKNGYSQPADLLYFLNFSDDDVFYQKSKIGKSFLRLLFFNSDDPNTQSLLYSCTVFMDENKYYKTYIDNMLLKDKVYVSVVESENEPITSSTFNVSSDTSNDDSEVTFDETIRLSSSFHVKNRYEMGESAEGFYLYIFKEYCEKLHEEPIYLKVEFNHAGEGKTVNFMMPYKIVDGDYILYDLTNEDDIKEFSKGVKLNEIHKHMYIPLWSVYDEKSKKYCYYLPQELTKSDSDKTIMRFNLYEIKIMDESVDIK